MPETGPEFNEDRLSPKNLLPKIREELAEGLLHEIKENPEAIQEFSDRMIRENPELMDIIVNLAEDTAPAGMQHNEEVLHSLLLLCKIMENQMEVNKMNKEFGK